MMYEMERDGSFRGHQFFAISFYDLGNNQYILLSNGLI